MYLVHARLAPSHDSARFPDEAATLLFAKARPVERVEHVVAHPLALPYPMLGIYLLADTLAQAETHATQLCRRAVADCPELGGWQLVNAQVPLVVPFYERLLDGSGPAGRIRPGTDPSSREPFHPH